MKRSSIIRSLAPALFVLAFGFVPAAGAQATAKVTCKDGTTSTATGRGACSAHGGVAVSATKATTKAEKAADKAAAKSEKTATKTEKAADKAASKTEKSVTKSAAKSEKAADRAAAKSDKAADKAAAKSEKAADKAATKSEKAADKAEKAEVAAGASGAVTAKCKDGTTSKAKNHRGACSGHGGVAAWVK